MAETRYVRGRLRPRWLMLIVLVFVVSVIVSMIQLRQAVQLLEQRPGTSVWSLFQLKNEYRSLKDQLRLYQHGLISHDDLLLRYDILWSRFPVLLEGVDAQQLAVDKDGLVAIQAAFSDLKTLESKILNLKPGDAEGVALILAGLDIHLPRVDKVALENFHYNNQFFRQNDERLMNLQMQLGYLLFGILLSGGSLLWLVVRESKHNRYQALHDSLTGMPNRKLLRQIMARLADRQAPFALHLLDLNGFKEVNDTLGHHYGDELLTRVASRLQQSVSERPDYAVARLGGDEFAIVQYPLKSRQEAEQVAQLIIEALSDAFEVDGNTCFVGASIGTSLYPDHGSRVRELLSHADLAMYQAKKQAPDSAFCFFESKFNEALKRRQQLHRDLRDALEAPDGQLYLVYQPIVELDGQRISSLEALLRWDHPQLGPIPPLETIEVAEQYGLGQQLGTWVIEEACRQNRRWQDEGEACVRIAVNISPSMYRLDLVGIVERALIEAHLPPACLTIEVTEDTTMKVLKDAMGLLPALQQLGVTIALDDFGTGLSSLSHLKDLPVQVLKIDRSFVKDLAQPDYCSKLIGGIIQLGHTLNMQVVAEGIEDEGIRAILKGYGCHYGQGYLYSKPLLPADIPAQLARHGVVKRAEMRCIAS